jgi:serine-protein kinase ATM
LLTVTADLTFASTHSIHARPFELANLIGACCGADLLVVSGTESVSGGSIAQSWKSQCEIAPIARYLLLLDDSNVPGRSIQCKQAMEMNALSKTADPASFHAAKKLTLELFFPKMMELEGLCESWAKPASEGGQQISPERFQSLFAACITGVMLNPLFADLNSRQSRDLEPGIFKLVQDCLKIVIDLPDSQIFFDLILRALRCYIPQMATADLHKFVKDNASLLHLCGSVAGALHDQTVRQASGQHQDFMDLDDDFDSQVSRASSISRALDIPRLAISMSLHSGAFNLDTTMRLYLLEAIYNDNGQVGTIPTAFLDQLLALSTEEFLSCQALIHDMFHSDLIVNPDDASSVIGKIGDIIGLDEFQTSEVALCICLDAIGGLAKVWYDEKLEVAESIGDLYNHFIQTALPTHFLSSQGKISLGSLLLCLLRHDPQYGTDQGLSSCRTILLSILQQGTMRVKYFIGTSTPDVFSLYVLKMHDDVFVDVLDSLPTDPESIEGIAFRLFVLSELACRWPTLLRRCTYHIFETPARIPRSIKYATCCLAKVSKALELESPRDLFNLFAPQILYTWLDNDSLEDIPFKIFGFASLADLLRTAQAEASGLMFMRGSMGDAEKLANLMGMTPADMVKKNFSKIMAYNIAHDIAISASDNESGESRIKKLLGRDGHLDAIYANFVDIAGLLFDLIDQEDPIERYWAKDESVAYAASTMAAMKKLAYSPVVLPPNQQPMFKAKYLMRELFHLCSRTEYELHAIWTPALVVSVARKLLNTVHPALGPLHACSVLRKVRVLFCLAGPVALEGYPLEMLLHSIRGFIVDSECADDALGITQYLISSGENHLTQAPSFLAGYALSTLASLRVFLESSQSSTTQESQFKATMSKAQQFHSWFGKYLAQYDSPAFKDTSQKDAFKSITQSASHIRSSGNADKGTHESNLLLEILQDEEREDRLLNESSQDLALGMLCGEFKIPSSGRLDVVENDDDAINYSSVVWKSCRAHALSNEYLSWAGRVVGRSFAASGEIQPDLLRESNLARYSKIAPGSNSSQLGLIHLLQALTMNKDSLTAGLAESALRAVVSEAEAHENELLLVACQKSMTESLFIASSWSQYRTPPSDNPPSPAAIEGKVFSPEFVESPAWIQELAICLARAGLEYTILRVLPSILSHVKGFAEQAFPFIVHLVLFSQLDRQQVSKRNLSEAIKEWLPRRTQSAKDNQKLIVNTILYLRTQEFPNEASTADRSYWLDIDLSSAASAASWCGMYKTALLFAELASSEGTRTSRRSSAARKIDSTDVLLTIFENIDDPDAYYGLPQTSSLQNVLARLEYEKDGTKSLAFRGAQYDSHIRRKDPSADSDSQSLVRALSSLGLSGLSHSLLQTQQSLEGSSTSLESTFRTARRLEMWNLPAPALSRDHSVVVYKAYQGIHQATDTSEIQRAINGGFSHTMRSLVGQGLNAASLRHHLGALAVFTELDDILRVSGFSELEEVLSKFEVRSQWMRRGRQVFQANTTMFSS